MTVEELEIIVTARIEDALKNMGKLIPRLKKIVKEAQQTVSSIDIEPVNKQIDNATNLARKKINDLKKSNKNNEIAIKINNGDVDKVVSETKKKIMSVKKQTEQLFDPSDVSGIKISGIDVKQIRGYSKELQKYIGNINVNKLKQANNEIRPIFEGFKNKNEAGDVSGLEIKGITKIAGVSKKKYQYNDKATKEYRAATEYELQKPQTSMANQMHEKYYQGLVSYEELKKYNSSLNSGSGIQMNIENSTAKGKIDEIKEKMKDIQYKDTNIFGGIIKAVEKVKPALSKIGETAKNVFGKIGSLASKVGKKIKESFSVKHTSGGLKSLLRYAGALLSIRGIYGLLRGAAQAWLSSQNEGAQQLSANINYMKYAMGSALAPVIQLVTNLVYQLLKAIQSLAYAFSGVNIFAKATASSMKSTAGSAKQASKSLSGVHSEINNVGDNGGGGSGGGEGSPNIDMSSLDSQMSPLAQKLYNFFKPLKDSWDNYGLLVTEAFHNAIDGIGASAGAMWSSVESIITNGTVYQIIANILNSIGQIGQAWANAWNNDNNGTELIQSIADIINDITIAVLNLVSSTGFQTFLDGVVSAFSGLVQFLEPVVQGFTEMAEKILEIVASTIGDLLKKIGDDLQAIGKNKVAVEILKAVGAAIAIIVAGIIAWNVAQIILNIALGIMNVLLSPITLIILAVVAAIAAIILIIKNWGAISEWFNDLWQKITQKLKEAWESVKQFFINLWNSIIQNIQDKWNGVKEFFSNLWNNISSTISNAWNNIKGNVKQGAQAAWDAITGVFGNITGWFRDKFSQAWQAVKNVFSSGGAIFDGIKEGILNGLKAVINAIIKGMNKVVSIPFNGLNWALNKLRGINIMGVSPFGWIKTLNVPQIPQLATGNVAKKPLIAEFGEYAGASTNPEITTPQNIMEETFERVMSRHDNSNQSVAQRISVQVGAEALFDEMIDYINDKTRRTGRNTIVMVGD